MRHTLTIISVLLFTSSLFAQKTKKRGSTSSWSDTTFIVVALQDTISDNKIVAVEIGEKATIFLKLKPMLVEAEEDLSNDFLKKYYTKILRYFEIASKKSDTIFVSDYHKFQHLEYLVSHQLIDGNAKVFYKKEKIFVDTISHRLEKYGGNADRFFYLPDKRPFFGVQEFYGILDDEDDLFGKGHFEAYVKEGEKLQGIRKQ